MLCERSSGSKKDFRAHGFEGTAFGLSAEMWMCRCRMLQSEWRDALASVGRASRL